MRVPAVMLLTVLLLSVTPARAAERELVVFAASSLTDAFTAIGANFEAAHPDTRVLFNFGGSSTLAAQLANGAPADLYASANPTQMEAAITAGRIHGTPQTFAHNRLVLITPADNPAHIGALADLAQPGILLILAAPGVPVRSYTDTLLDRMAAAPAYGESFRAAVLANLASEGANVRVVAAKVALGEADAGIVYSSDVTPDIRADVTALPIPDTYNTLAPYPIARTDDSAHPDLAEAFITYVRSETGQQVLADWGFIPLKALTEDAPTRETLNARWLRWRETRPR